jgi:putative DNA methylase
VREYRSLLASGEANATRLKTPSEFKNRDLEPGTRGLGGTLLRQVLYAVYETGAEEEPAPARGRTYLRDVLTPQGYWDNRQTVLQLLDYLARRPSPAMAHWRRDAEMARLLHGYVQNDSV